ncbi:Retrovirus-related Pol polyprotein from transposon [Apostichopus japonicus]|uniref:Retrovirus-related Pol polyprotein from transposon n=1 Tax=Stichopus japonicus TaxID=307972 RepID=A0A2G8LJX0_STIJA|nr:Retrovirus-related Pol polyprotein from transposon [Apostichopus japonicus]
MGQIGSSTRLLCRRWENHAGDCITWQFIVPRSLQEEVIQLLHDNPTSGHLGVRRTMYRVQERYYWNTWRRKVERWCKMCKVCCSRKGPTKGKAKLQTYRVGIPMERIAIDILGPLPLTDRNNKYIMVVADYFTKWVEAFPLKDQSAETVADTLVTDFVSRFGVPKQIHTDQGRNFESNLFKELCQLLGVDKTRTTPYHPQSDGMVERFNRTLEEMLAKVVDSDQKNWDKCIPLVMMAYRSSIHESTGHSPAEMMLGREIPLPVDTSSTEVN